MAAADSAYSSEEIRETLLRRNPDIELLICEKGTRGYPLTDEQKARNREISRIRARVEHGFGRMPEKYRLGNYGPIKLFLAFPPDLCYYILVPAPRAYPSRKVYTERLDFHAGMWPNL